MKVTRRRWILFGDIIGDLTSEITFLEIMWWRQSIKVSNSRATEATLSANLTWKPVKPALVRIHSSYGHEKKRTRESARKVEEYKSRIGFTYVLIELWLSTSCCKELRIIKPVKRVIALESCKNISQIFFILVVDWNKCIFQFDWSISLSLIIN